MYKDKKIGIVILNYKDANSVINLCNLVEQYEIIDKIVIIDNLSPDDSLEQLKKLASEKTEVIVADRNGGYSYGNNYGAFYLIDKYAVDILFIANPDVKFEENILISISEILSQGDIHAASGMMLLLDGSEGDVFKNKRRYCEDLCSCTILLKKILLKNTDKVSLGDDIIKVYRLPGSFFGILAESFKDIGGFDDGVFLYSEEDILGSKMEKHGYKCVIDTSSVYVHMESISIDKSIDHVRKIEQVYKSLFYYYKNYAEIDSFRLFLLGIFMNYGLFMRKILYPLRKILK